MRKMGVLAAIAATSVAASSALATDTLQLDVNGMTIQVKDAGGSAAAFTGVNHTGSIEFGYSGAAPATSLRIFKELGAGSGFSDEGLQSITGVDGFISLSSGAVTGGELKFSLGNGDEYYAQVQGGSGMVQTASTPGGYKIDGRTFGGMFTDPQADSMYGTVDVSQWIDGEPLRGSFLQFNFSPDSTGFGRSDVDVFVVVPLPPAAWAGMGMLAGVMGLSYTLRRR